ncbi:hypothetical protein SAMN05216266_103329 [Amycolatopsis marina]|uniref:4-amino-4-deoxy-L-arabinose transferase n=1 Tax=Amycolatopsis marina TaxID=490629 RepID=A0A1I0XM94_9PSEU|nr:DUF6541 family protein [Amycolatopsis marina]SFB02111.1 hypothetical protein SAMN05216266_103329 [Amycolatopsis marina]
MSWWQLVPAVLCTVAIVFLPGYLVVRSWAITGLVAVGTAAPVSIGLLAGAAVAGPMIGVRWSVLLLVVPTVILAAIGLVLRRLTPGALNTRRATSRPVRHRWTLLVYAGALLIPAVMLARGLIVMIGSPDNISQTYDNIFHLNALRYILDSGSGSTLTLGGMYSNGADPSTYPAAWHDLVSLVVQVSGASIPASINAVTLVVGALVWPISCIFLTTRVTGVRPVPVLFAGALSTVFGAFPYLMVTFGVLYPFFLSLALLPAAIALVAMAVGVGGRDGTPRWLAALVLIGAVVPGVALAHPSSVLALLVFAVPIFVVGIVRYRRTLSTGRAIAVRYWGLIVLLLCYLSAVVLLWTKIRPSESASAWEPIQQMPQAIGQVLAAGLMQQGPTWIVLLLTLVAIGLVMRRLISAWVVGIYLIAAGLFVIVSGFRESWPRDFVTGVWYNDSFRLAGQLPVITVVLCTISATWLFTRSQESLSGRFPKLSWLRPTRETTPAISTVAFVAAVVLAVVGQYSSVNYEIAHGKATYRIGENSYVLSLPERALIERLDEQVPPDATIIGNPWTGTSLAYALADRRTLTPHVGNSIPQDVLTVMYGLNEMATNPQVCSIIQRLNSYYVLHFEGRQVHNKGKHFDGLESLPTNPGVTRIDHEGATAALYKITGC